MSCRHAYLRLHSLCCVPTYLSPEVNQGDLHLDCLVECGHGQVQRLRADAAANGGLADFERTLVDDLHLELNTTYINAYNNTSYFIAKLFLYH